MRPSLYNKHIASVVKAGVRFSQRRRLCGIALASAMLLCLMSPGTPSAFGQTVASDLMPGIDCSTNLLTWGESAGVGVGVYNLGARRSEAWTVYVVLSPNWRIGDSDDRVLAVLPGLALPPYSSYRTNIEVSLPINPYLGMSEERDYTLAVWVLPDLWEQSTANNIAATSVNLQSGYPALMVRLEASPADNRRPLHPRVLLKTTDGQEKNSQDVPAVFTRVPEGEQTIVAYDTGGVWGDVIWFAGKMEAQTDILGPQGLVRNQPSARFRLLRDGVELGPADTIAVGDSLTLSCLLTNPAPYGVHAQLYLYQRPDPTADLVFGEYTDHAALFLPAGAQWEITFPIQLSEAGNWYLSYNLCAYVGAFGMYRVTDASELQLLYSVGTEFSVNSVKSVTAYLNGDTDPVTTDGQDAISKSADIRGVGSGKLICRWECRPCDSGQWTAMDEFAVSFDEGQASVEPTLVVLPSTGCWEYRLAVLSPSFLTSAPVTILYPPEERLLSVPYYSQGPTKWCADAAAAMILRYVGVLVKPRDLAARFTQDPRQGVAVTTTAFEETLARFGARIDRHVWRKSNSGSFDKEALQDYLIASLASGKPVLLQLYDQAHAVVTVGYSRNGIYIHDPSGATVAKLGGEICVAYHVRWDDFHAQLYSVSDDGFEPEFITVRIENAEVGDCQPPVTADIGPAKYDSAVEYPDAISYTKLSDFVFASSGGVMKFLTWDGTKPLGYWVASRGGVTDPLETDELLGVVLDGGDSLDLCVSVRNSSERSAVASVSCAIDEVDRFGNFKQRLKSLSTPPEPLPARSTRWPTLLPWTNSDLRLWDLGFLDADPQSRQYLRFSVSVGYGGDTYDSFSVRVAVNDQARWGSVRVVLSPVDAVAAGAKWCLDGGAWQPSGGVVDYVAAGAHRILYYGPGEWIAPPGEQIEVSNGTVTDLAREYLPVDGALLITLAPTEAVSAGARWRLDNAGPWYDNTVGPVACSAGLHQVTYATAGGWTAPAAETVTVPPGRTIQLARSYVLKTGSLMVQIEPAAVAAAGARWRVRGGPWFQSGERFDNCPVGAVEVECSAVEGWEGPGTPIVGIKLSELTSLTVAYRPLPSRLRLQVGRSQGAVEVSWQPIATLDCVLESADDLRQPRWTPTASQELGEGRQGVRTQATGKHQFFRLRVP